MKMLLFQISDAQIWIKTFEWLILREQTHNFTTLKFPIQRAEIKNYTILSVHH